jgi:hypothetical protein
VTRSPGAGWGLLLAVVCLSASGAADPLAEGLRACALRAEEAQRLACFDALVSALPKTAADQFGMTSEIARKRTPPGEPRTPSDEALPGKIVALGETTSGKNIFTLDNGQVWIQAEPQPHLRFEAGDVIRIEHGAMSSLWLTADKNRKTRVKRVK